MGIPRDPRAARVLRELRLNKGLSPEGLSHAIHLANGGTVSGKTIRRTEHAPYPIPQVRVRFAIAAYFGRDVIDIWKPQRSRPAIVPVEQEAVAA